MRKITSIEVLEDYCLDISFDNQETKILDMKPFIDQSDHFQILKNKNIFQCVSIIDNGIAIAWNDHLDLCAHAIYQGLQIR